ncbi:dTTP/UTP pyrophosphatase [Culicoides brevitarsis]|uniref:dTTP/UTP pyrophosphatase n=1 Tax=Culicoides brevitarsis TaxID=469753 RepID=UPI00307BB9E5
MLQPILHQLKTKNVILASGSPRRQELIKNLGVDVQLCPSLFEENLDPKNFPDFGAFVEETAYQKVLEVHERLSRDAKKPDIVIGADTMVTLGDKLYGKPKNGPMAFQMLSELIGKKHTVYTGVAIKYGEKVSRFTEKTDVFFGDATSAQIQAYVDTGEPLDKAGGYGIQGVGGCLIERIEGDYFTVVGLPLYRLCTELIKLFD